MRKWFLVQSILTFLLIVLSSCSYYAKPTSSLSVSDNNTWTGLQTFNNGVTLGAAQTVTATAGDISVAMKTGDTTAWCFKDGATSQMCFDTSADYVAMGVPLGRSQNTYVPAGTPSQATCTPITTDIAFVDTTGSGLNLGLCLPAIAYVGQEVWLVQKGGGSGVWSFFVYPATGATINDRSANNNIRVYTNGDTSTRGGFVIFFATSATAWEATPIMGTISGQTLAPKQTQQALYSNIGITFTGAAATFDTTAGDLTWSLKTNSGTSLAFKEGATNVLLLNTAGTNVVEAYAQVYIAAGTDNYALQLDGASGRNDIQFPQNIADGMSIHDAGGADFLTFVSTTGTKRIDLKQPLKGTIATPVAAAGTDITNCGAIPAGTVWVHITGNDGTKGVCLPTTTSVTTCVQVMAEVVGSTLKVYGADADTNPTVNGGSSDAAYAQLGGTSLIYCNSGVAWTSY